MSLFWQTSHDALRQEEEEMGADDDPAAGVPSSGLAGVDFYSKLKNFFKFLFTYV